VRIGTARRTFRQRGFQVPGAVGKTGSLADKNPFRDYSWFVGYAPKDDPKVAVAAVIVNDLVWRMRATYPGRETPRPALEGENRWRTQPAVSESAEKHSEPAQARPAPSPPRAAHGSP